MNNCKKSSDKKFFFLCKDCEGPGKPNIELLFSSAKKPINKKSEHTSLFFLLEGQVEISCDTTTRQVEKGYFFLIPANKKYIIRLMGNTKFLICHLEEKFLVQQKRNEGLLHDIYNMKFSDDENWELYTVEINRYIQSLLEDCTGVMNGGFPCTRYTQCKTKELLILLRSYYPNELLARLFHPAFTGKVDFHETVKKNRNKFFTVEEFAAATNMDRNTFRQKFKDTYGKNPAEWLKQERVNRVFQELMEGNKTITEIVTDYNFSNFPNFIRFCNLHYKNTPGNIRKIMEKPG